MRMDRFRPILVTLAGFAVADTVALVAAVLKTYGPMGLVRLVEYMPQIMKIATHH